MSIFNFTDSELVALRHDHTPSDIPPCRVCGGPMKQVGNTEGGKTDYRCWTAAQQQQTGWSYHYRDSATTHQLNPKGDPTIIRLIDTIEEYRRLFAELEAIR